MQYIPLASTTLGLESNPDIRSLPWCSSSSPFRDGQLVSSSTMVALVKEAIQTDDSERFLLDGFPRSKDNLDAWFEVFSDDEVQVL